jgi:sugar phosphate permease
MKQAGVDLPLPTGIHYGCIIVGVGSLVLFSCFGLARYAFTMLIPGMQAGLDLSYDRIGFIGTGNFVGYLISVILATPVMRRIGAWMTIAAGLLLLSLCVIGLSAAHGFLNSLSLYFLVGLGGGFANIPMMALLTYWFRSEQRGKAVGLVIGSNGAGIILAGFLVPMLNRLYGANGWRSGWLFLGLLCLAVSISATLFLRNSPGEVGLEPVGRAVPPNPDRYIGQERRGDGIILLKLGLLYLAFGVTFIVYVTFIVTTMIKEYGFSEARAGFY